MPAPTSAPNPNPFLELITLFLMPFFVPVCPDGPVARSEILETLAAYGATSRSQVINATRIVAFSFVALETLVESKEPDISPSMRVRYRGCANNLNRSCQQNESMLTDRLAAERSTPPQHAATRPPAAEPTNDLMDTDAQAALDHARTEINKHRKGLPGPRSSILPSRDLAPAEQQENNRLWGNAMMTVLAELGMPVQPAVS